MAADEVVVVLVSSPDQSDQLYELLELSYRYTAEYFVGLARKATSPESYLQQLKKNKKTGAIKL